MRTWSFYDQATGQISTRRYRASNDKALESNTPAGCVAIEGQFDNLSQMVDVKTGEVVDYQPPSPGDDFEWNAERRRHVKKPAVLAAERRDKLARSRIAELESGQARAIREHALGDASAAAKLQAIDDEIKTLRTDLIQERR